VAFQTKNANAFFVLAKNSLFLKKSQVTAPGVLPSYTEFPFMLFRAPQNLSLILKERKNYILLAIFVNSFSGT